MSQNLTAVDLFSGAGGFSLAAHNVGIEVLIAIEFDLAASETYQRNLVERLGAPTQVFAQDITKNLALVSLNASDKFPLNCFAKSK